MNNNELQRIITEIQFKIDSGKSKAKDGVYRIAYTFPGENSYDRITVRGKSAYEIATKLIMARDKRDESIIQKEKQGKRFDKIAAAWYESECNRGVCDKTNDTNRHILNDLILPVFGACSIDSISRQSIKDFLAEQGSKYRKDYLKKIKGVFDGVYAYANDAEITTYYPLNNFSLKKIKCVPPMPDEHKHPVSDDELLKVLIVSKKYGQFTLIIAMLFVYGFRPVELVNLKWKNINFDNETIFVEVSKYTNALNYDPSKYQRTLPLTPVIKKLLLAEKKKSKTEYIFHKRKNKTKMDTDSLDGYFDTLTRDLEILNGAVVSNNKIIEYTGVRHFSPYAFRRRRITELNIDPKFNETLVDAFDGHALKGVNGQNYTRLDYELHLEKPFKKHLVKPDKQLEKLLKEAGIEL